MLESFYTTGTEPTHHTTDLDRLSVLLALTPEELEELLAMDFMEPLYRQAFGNDGYVERLRAELMEAMYARRAA